MIACGKEVVARHRRGRLFGSMVRSDHGVFSAFVGISKPPDFRTGTRAHRAAQAAGGPRIGGLKHGGISHPDPLYMTICASGTPSPAIMVRVH